MFRNFKTIFILLLAVIIAALVYYFYKRSKQNKTESIAELIVQNESENQNLITIFRKEYDLEKLDGIENVGLISKTKACSGKQSSEMNSEIEYGINLIFPLDILPGGSNLAEVKISSAVWTEDAGEAQWVLEIRDPDQKILFWNSSMIAPGKHTWDTLSFSFQIPVEYLNRINSLKFYPWNKSHKDVWIDNINISFIGTATKIKGRRSGYKSVNYFLSYEEGEKLTDDGCLTDEMARTGLSSTVIKGNDSYSNSFTKTVREIADDTLRRVSLGVWIYPEQKNPFLMLVVTVKNASGETVFWEGRSSEKLEFAAKTWQKFNAEIVIPPDKRQLISMSDQVVVYIWNRSSVKVFADDMEIVYGDEASRPGLLPFADMNLSSRETYSFDRIHGPYRVNYLDNINLTNTEYLVSEKNQEPAKVFPSDEIISLKLKSSQKELVLHLSGNSFELYNWCEETASFVFLAKSEKLPFLKKGTQLYAYDADQDGSSEILAINNGKGKIFKLTNSDFSSCSSSHQNLATSILWEGDVNSNTCHLVDDFNGDGKDDMLSVNMETQKWELLGFRNNKWFSQSTGFFPPNSFSANSAVSSGHFVPANKNTQMLIAFEDSSKNVCVLYEFNRAAKNFRKLSTSKESYLTQIFIPGMKLFKANLDGDAEDELLTFNHDWRFDMKIVDCDSKGFYIFSQLDFKGYKNSCNPKYYEIIKPIVGNFTGTNPDNLLMVLANCADEKYNGNSCAVYGGSPDLPNQIQMYSLKIF